MIVTKFFYYMSDRGKWHKHIYYKIISGGLERPPDKIRIKTFALKLENQGISFLQAYE
jgi:hypothetical protein